MRGSSGLAILRNGSITGDISWGCFIALLGLLGFYWQVIGMIGAGKNQVDTCIMPAFYAPQKGFLFNFPFD
jgi:hypothetical protein